ncbi:uncharacterized protein BX663DRAFT_503014 [Cokeromyces recurvatus]|uniref:uncharacterized protein n=1 Tax=Cokeromyces recurvatus TaxID=90255 RepID=UPI0022201A49|nr:uncharacterized protein BX663DRAFT_503014 [Cokeromyces recurvatus]KAI7904628.1 hypothetical protein BX663DRAFT_503014 [Cokeromyces recurvatus]
MSYYGDRDRGDRDREDRSRPNPCRLYIGRVSRYVRESDLRDLFSRYGRIRDLLLRDFYAFIEYDDVRDAEDATKALNGYRLENERLIVQIANAARNRSERSSRRDCDSRERDYDRDRGRDRDRRDRGSENSDRCYNCGEFGHM